MLPTTKEIHISTYTKRLITKHIGYVVALVFFIALLVSFIPYQVRGYLETRRQLREVQDQTADMEKRKAVIVQYPIAQLDDLVITLNTLYPSVEDRFSIFTALDNLQGVTGITVVSYSSPFSGKTLNELSIGVKATADMAAYRTFLRSHVYKSGRFMTIEKVVYDAKNQTLGFTAKYYSRDIEIGSQSAMQYSPDAITRLQAIQREVESAGLVKKEAPAEEREIPINYSTKQNPFQ